MKPFIKWTFVLFFQLIYIFSFAQDANQTKEEPKFDNAGDFEICFGLGQAIVTDKTQDRLTKSWPVPSISLDFDYFIWNRIGIGLHSDYNFKDYLIQRDSAGVIVNTDVIRNRYLVSIFVMSFKLTKALQLCTGPGMQLRADDGKFVYRIGLDYGFEVAEGLEVSLGGDFDYKKSENTVQLSFGITKIFKTKKNKNDLPSKM